MFLTQFGHFFKLLAIKEFETDPVRAMWNMWKKHQQGGLFWMRWGWVRDKNDYDDGKAEGEGNVVHVEADGNVLDQVLPAIMQQMIMEISAWDLILAFWDSPKIVTEKMGCMQGSLKHCSQQMLQDVQHEPRLRWRSRHPSLLVQSPRCPRSKNETEMKYIKEKFKLEPFFSKPKVMLQRKKYKINSINPSLQYSNLIFPGLFEFKCNFSRSLLIQI